MVRLADGHVVSVKTYVMGHPADAVLKAVHGLLQAIVATGAVLALGSGEVLKQGHTVGCIESGIVDVGLAAGAVVALVSIGVVVGIAHGDVHKSHTEGGHLHREGVGVGGEGGHVDACHIKGLLVATVNSVGHIEGGQSGGTSVADGEAHVGVAVLGSPGGSTGTDSSDTVSSNGSHLDIVEEDVHAVGGVAGEGQVNLLTGIGTQVDSKGVVASREVAKIVEHREAGLLVVGGGNHDFQTLGIGRLGTIVNTHDVEQKHGIGGRHGNLRSNEPAVNGGTLFGPGDTHHCLLKGTPTVVQGGRRSVVVGQAVAIGDPTRRNISVGHIVEVLRESGLCFCGHADGQRGSEK